MKVEMFWFVFQYFFLFFVVFYIIMIYVWNLEVLYFFFQCKVNVNMENVMVNFKDGYRFLKELESIWKDIWFDLGIKMLQYFYFVRFYRVGLFIF